MNGSFEFLSGKYPEGGREMDCNCPSAFKRERSNVLISFLKTVGLMTEKRLITKKCFPNKILLRFAKKCKIMFSL